MYKQIRAFLIEIKNKHFFLFLAIIMSFILSFLPFMYCLLTYYLAYKIIGYLFLLPFFTLLFFTTLAKVTHKKYPKTTNIITFIINTFIIIIVQIIIGALVILFSFEANIEHVGNNTKYYTKILQYFPQDKTIHFPKQIPNEAKNVQLYSEIFNFFGSQVIVLKFDIDEQYIQNELKRYKFKSKESTNHYAFSTMGGEKIKIKDFTLFVIDGNLDRWAKNYGIGVNKEFNQILYYYTNPD